jgi:L-asparaginase
MPPRVALIGTGGTISSLGRDSLDVWEYMDGGQMIGPADLLARYPETARVATVVPAPYKAVASSSMGPADWLRLIETIDDAARREAPLAGVVITHGTATLEETAYLLNLAVRADLTVVVVGAQRPASGLSSDAGMNLVGALRVAAAPEARGLGVLVLLNDEIQAAREVTKTSTLRLETFRSADLGMLGYADPDGRVAIYEFDVSGRRDLPRVDIAYSYAGADGAAIDAFVTAGARAIVSASLAPGMTTAAEEDALARARRHGVVIVLSSRAGSGRVLPRAVLRRRGWVVADNLLPQKARILAMLALTRTDDPPEVQRIFDEY